MTKEELSYAIKNAIIDNFCDCKVPKIRLDGIYLNYLKVCINHPQWNHLNARRGILAAIIMDWKISDNDYENALIALQTALQMDGQLKKIKIKKAR